MRLLFKLFFSTLAVITVVFSSSVCAGIGKPFNNIIFFGDSLSDNGNLYRFDLGFLPRSPTYFNGRFSNGPVWSDYAATYFNDKNKSTATNFAIGGESAILHNPLYGNLPYSLTASYESYRLRNAFSDKSQTLFVIWIGSNDYTRGSDNVEKDTSTVVDNIKATIDSLIGLGGMNFLVVNLPDFSNSPFGNSSTPTFKATLLALNQLHNQKLAAAVTQLQNEYGMVNVQLFDMHAMFDGLVADTAAFNTKYNASISNVTDSCWPGGYSLKRNAANLNAVVDARQITQTVKQDYSNYLAQHTQVKALSLTDDTKTTDADALSHFVADAPVLSESYEVQTKAAAGAKACVNPNAYAFWDKVHPSAVVHKAMSVELIKFIDEKFSRS